MKITFKSAIGNLIKYGSAVGFVLLIAVLIVQGLLPGEQSARQSNAVGERVDDVLSVFAGNERVPAAGLSVNGFVLGGEILSPAEKITVRDGDSFDLLASVTPENASNKSIVYTASGSVSVSATGRVTAIRPGSGKVKAASEESPSQAKEIEVTVLAIDTESVAIVSPPASLYEGQTRILNIDFTPLNASFREAIWSSSDPAVAEVDGNGKVYAK
ncbi:MAG: Ig-like domain-containing protein, partial [Clostridia bacterium]|nr:Ig-like domain-containing protein [Clostridia bacterium]